MPVNSLGRPFASLHTNSTVPTSTTSTTRLPGLVWCPGERRGAPRVRRSQRRWHTQLLDVCRDAGIKRFVMAPSSSMVCHSLSLRRAAPNDACLASFVTTISNQRQRRSLILGRPSNYYEAVLWTPILGLCAASVGMPNSKNRTRNGWVGARSGPLAARGPVMASIVGVVDVGLSTRDTPGKHLISGLYPEITDMLWRHTEEIEPRH